MRIAGERRIIIPPQLAFGERGVPDRVPPNSQLVCDIYIVDIVATDST